MNYSTMLDNLGLRLEDPSKQTFTDSFKLKTLENAQIIITHLLNNDYITELQVIDANESVSSGDTLFTALDNDVLRGAEGIVDIKVYNGLWATKQDRTDIKKGENSLLVGTTKNPLWWTFANIIKILPTTISAIDVWYLKMPVSPIFAFTSDALGGGAADTGFEGGAGEELVATDDHYNGSVIYNIDLASYHVVTDYTAASFVFTVEPVGASNFVDGQTFYFVTHDFFLTNIDGISNELDSSLHDLIVTFAEAECWKSSGNLNRMTAALQKSIDTIVKINGDFETPTGIGTQTRRREV